MKGRVKRSQMHECPKAKEGEKKQKTHTKNTKRSKIYLYLEIPLSFAVNTEILEAFLISVLN